MSWIISAIKIQGIKGVLDQSGDFYLSKNKRPKSMVVFAPNGCGKSGYADAIEYLFSEDGMVEHLGKGGADSERGGKHALPHVLAVERGIESQVSLSLLNTVTGETINLTREVKTGRSDPRPTELDNIIRLAPAHRILRQHDLRRFVVEMSPGDKYSELARWIGLSKLEQILKQLVTTKNTLQNTNLDREFKERETDLKVNTNNEIVAFDLPTVLHWCANQASSYLEAIPTIQNIDDLPPVVKDLQKARDDIIRNSGASDAYEAKQSLEKELPKLLGADGLLAICNHDLLEARSADDTYQTELGKAKNNIFQEVWTSSSKLLTETHVENCPICNTEWPKTEVGSQEVAVKLLQSNLRSLSEVKIAESFKFEKFQTLISNITFLSINLNSLIQNLRILKSDNLILQLETTVNELKPVLSSIGLSTQIEKAVSGAINQVSTYIDAKLMPGLEKFEIKELPETAKKIDQIAKNIENLKETAKRLGELEIERQEYRKVEKSFDLVANTIRERAAQLTNQVVDAFRDDVLSIYRAIHPNSIVPNIHIVPNTEDRTLGLRIDFHHPGRTVPPAGYLSESYINTLGLSLFISSVRLFNKDFPFILLDDIVSSYDADHRARIVDVIAEQLENFQVFLTTHDGRFYAMLRDRLNEKDWKFEKIVTWNFEHGPQRESDAGRPDEVEQIIANNSPDIAGNVVRQYMEEWLDKMCAKYKAYTLHKRGFKDFDRTLFDLWSPFIDRLKTIKGNFFENNIESENCYSRLKAHSLLNFYSHSQSNPYEWPDISDVQYVWIEFQAFEKLFNCASCGKQLKFEHEESRLYCTCGGQISRPSTK